MKTHYYFSWFNDFFPEKLVKLLQEDVQDRKSLVMISADPSGYTGEQINFDDVSEWRWLNQANIIFDEYHFIDYRMQKEDARRFIQNASVIFLCGGYPVLQNDFLTEYELSDVIKNSNAVIMGASAGALNMAAKWLSLNNTDEVETSAIYDGIGFDQFAYESHSQRDYATFVQGYMFPLSEEIDVYAAEQESAVRVKDGKIEIMGPVYLISQSKIQKLVETL
ncbi:Type 1 glutamine amidotransferase-like domain-containing protein [Paenibacillus taichungensis]|uniref:Type 1 glutamine amidotransferase-like domain-containing protein n=1 Tax=Paenibacillus taichungensis TaxID=484184 RepID=UPI002DBB7664|nr:Type 1 glutamine amidotransferase-like domain-containing protein [Paenibacillus taichungensis]MEC0109958.1 Type 1 glutamine amidotransferase-like domain-containing protein [Paenibacillus taichungensis]MEC0199218.1 Type 1 glutamine amidotransferase-like domain-containing protein [Paenibacillus taichungensis]